MIGVSMNNFDLFTSKDGIEAIIESCRAMFSDIAKLDLDEKVEAINTLREMLHEISPFNTEPVDYVRWVKNPLVHANDYNPNSVAPPEMALLHRSIQADGYTQPIVSMPDPDGHSKPCSWVFATSSNSTESA